MTAVDLTQIHNPKVVISNVCYADARNIPGKHGTYYETFMKHITILPTIKHFNIIFLLKLLALTSMNAIMILFATNYFNTIFYHSFKVLSVIFLFLRHSTELVTRLNNKRKRNEQLSCVLRKLSETLCST